MGVILLESCCPPHLMPAGAPQNAWLLVGAGFVISLGHCLGMCGPLMGAYSAAQRRAAPSAWHLVPALLTYHLGRLAAYALLGLALGLLGSAARLAGDGGSVLQGALALVAGLVMGLLGLGLAGWLPTRRWFETETLGGWIRRLLGGLASRSPGGRKGLSFCKTGRRRQ